MLPPNHDVLHRAIRGMIPTQPERLASALPKQANLRVCLLCFPPNLASPYIEAGKLTNAGRLARLPALFSPNHSVLHRARGRQANLRVCLHCFPPNHRFASRHTKAGKLASLPALLPPNHDVLHRAIPRQALIPTQPERLASALPKQANLRVCLLCFPPNLASPYIEAGKLINAGRLARLPALFSLNHSVLHRAMRKQANLGVCLHCFLPNHSARVASYQSRQTCEFACFGAAQP